MCEEQRGSAEWDLLPTVLGELGLAMAVMDHTRRLVHVSPALEAMADAPFKPIASDHVPSYFQLYDPSGRRLLRPSELTLVRACSGETVHDSCVTVKPSAGPVRLLRCTAAPLRDGSGAIRGAFLVATDVTEEQPIVSLPPELRRQRFETLQHEFRTPLTSLLGHAELLQDLGPELTEEAHLSLACLLRAGERLRVALDSLTDILDGRGP
ncbi:PAS domain-containing protein [Nocardioides sp.]|uniref:PAS domain-containing protein n=1 Tax=Nocardioides sp. TaxID=35761 RepID=UPI0027214D26|nr:PAS domain-containing protein [Nocardioides sp.]MDO9455380.1 PAS domain-containing protein [Nocardioides sp.]